MAGTCVCQSAFQHVTHPMILTCHWQSAEYRITLLRSQGFPVRNILEHILEQKRISVRYWVLDKKEFS